MMNNIHVMEWAIARSSLIVANDTGLHHLAGMHGKNGFILWKDTKLPKNKSFNENFFISHDWINDFDKWLK
jgi:ADP-heptose:LPS heptosyltransferase